MQILKARRALKQDHIMNYDSTEKVHLPKDYPDL